MFLMTTVGVAKGLKCSSSWTTDCVSQAIACEVVTYEEECDNEECFGTKEEAPTLNHKRLIQWNTKLY